MIKEITDRIEHNEKKIEELRSELKMESMFNRKVDLNVKIKTLMEEGALLKAGF